ncbi:MAG: hypothetical protein AAGA20_11035 [Planctomycetota bacterium]
MSLLVAFLATVFAVPFLAALALELGWVDRRDGAEHRKPRRAAVPLVGGAAILAALVAASQVDAGLGLAWPALIVAFLLGLVDDVLPRGLRAWTKFVGQVGVGVLVFVAPGPAWAGLEGPERFALGCLAVVAMNAVNTFDHHDGLAGLVGALGLPFGAPAAAAACAAYLPFNTVVRRRPGGRGEGVPLAMLGDSGSHLLGVLIATTPGAAVLLTVPLLDLARVVWQRRSRGQPFWVGDRTHLGHRLEALGLGPLAVAGIVALLLAPPTIATALWTSEVAPILGVVVSAFLYFVAVDATSQSAGQDVRPALLVDEFDEFDEAASVRLPDPMRRIHDRPIAPEPAPEVPGEQPEPEVVAEVAGDSEASAGPFALFEPVPLPKVNGTHAAPPEEPAVETAPDLPAETNGETHPALAPEPEPQPHAPAAAESAPTVDDPVEAPSEPSLPAAASHPLESLVRQNLFDRAEAKNGSSVDDEPKNGSGVHDGSKNGSSASDEPNQRGANGTSHHAPERRSPVWLSSGPSEAEERAHDRANGQPPSTPVPARVREQEVDVPAEPEESAEDHPLTGGRPDRPKPRKGPFADSGGTY